MINVIFYTEAGPGVGLGHVMRCVTLAIELESRGCRCVFIGNDHVASQAKRLGFDSKPAVSLPSAHVYVADLRGGVPLDVAKTLQNLCQIFVILDDCAEPPDPARFQADFVVYPGITDRPYTKLDWTGFSGEWYEGTEWILLHEKYRGHKPRSIIHGSTIVVSGGGSDPLDVTTRVVGELINTQFEVLAIIGPNNTQFKMESSDNIMVLHNPDDMSQALKFGEIAIISYGNTVFECLALGIPVLAIPVFGDHDESVSLLAQRSGGTVHNLGPPDKLQDGDILAAAWDMMVKDPYELSKKAAAFVDGRGAERVADRIMERLCAAS